MKAYEFEARIMPDGKLDIPAAVMKRLPQKQAVRVIILIGEPMDVYEQQAWSRLTAEQFLAGYSEADAIYDRLG